MPVNFTNLTRLVAFAIICTTNGDNTDGYK